MSINIFMMNLLNENILYFKCSKCGMNISPTLNVARCKECGGALRVIYDYDGLADTVRVKLRTKGRMSVWRYWDLLPLSRRARPVTLLEGGTPLIKSRRLSRMLKVRLLLKNETVNPTGSFLDRGSTVVISLIRRIHKRVCCIANGNLGASLAAYAARSDISFRFFVTRPIDKGELYQMSALGAELIFSRSYDEALKQVLSDEESYYVGCDNPFLLEGEKTTAFEIIEELRWKVPDWIIVPCGSGGHLSMIWKGIEELREIGLIDKAPRLVGVQPSAFPLLKLILEGRRPLNMNYEVDTIARDLVLEGPLMIEEAAKAIRNSRGVAVIVDDEEILDALKLLARYEGIIAEPSSASTLAALMKLLDNGIVDHDEEVVCIITGSGLKTQDVLSYAKRPSASHPLTETKREILRLLKVLKRAHGYLLWKKLMEEGVSISLPALYHHLKELEETGYVKSQVVRCGRRIRKVYELSTAPKCS